MFLYHSSEKREIIQLLRLNVFNRFRTGRGCAEQVFTLRNIIEHDTEWQTQLYVNFIDFAKAFDSLHRESLRKILRMYGVHQHLVLVIKSFYNNFTCKVGNSKNSCQVYTKVRQGCVMTALPFNIAIGWIMTRTTEDQNRGIRWTLYTKLEDLDYADDLALIFHMHQNIEGNVSTHPLC